MKKTLQEVREYINEGVYDPGIFKAFFLAGGPGSGKTFVTQSAFAGTGLKLVNSDVKFERDLKKANLSLKMPDEEAYFRDIIRKGAKEFVGKQIDQYIKGRLGLIIDATGRDYGHNTKTIFYVKTFRIRLLYGICKYKFRSCVRKK